MSAVRRKVRLLQLGLGLLLTVLGTPTNRAITTMRVSPGGEL